MPPKPRLHLKAVQAVFLTALLCLAAGGSRCRAGDTTFVREFAKNKPSVFLVVSGPQADATARLLQAAILRHPDNRHSGNDIQIMSIPDAARVTWSSGEFSKSPLVFLLNGSEMSGPLPPVLSGLLPPGATAPGGYTSVAESSLNSARSSSLIFTTLLYAPDAERLQRLYDIFLQRQTQNFRDLAFSSEYPSNKLAVFSAPEDKDATSQWGTSAPGGAWDYIEWHPLSDAAAVAPRLAPEFSQAYFLDRSRHEPPPAPAAALLAGRALKPTTTFIVRAEAGRAGSLAVFSAPDSTILHRKVQRFPNMAALSNEPTIEDAADLRLMRRTALLVTGPDTTAAERAQLTDAVGEQMRPILGVPIEDRPAVLSALQQALPSAAPDAAAIGRRYGLRYVWVLKVSEYRGATGYRASAQQIGSGVAPFSDLEPVQPTRAKDEPDYQYDHDTREWQREHDRWERHRDEYQNEVEYNTPFQWRRVCTRVSGSRLSGVLRVIDLQAAGRVLWQKDCAFTVHESAVYSSDTTSVLGSVNRPPPMDLPPATATCAPDLMRQAAQKAASAALETLQEEAMLPQ